MKIDFKKWINESFDTISNFLLNPENRYKTWNELIEEFKASGGEILGHGSHATTYSHPSWKYVLKIYSNDPIYTKFVRFAYKHKDSVFPKFYGLPQKIIPEYTRTKSHSILNIVRMEKLYEVDKNLSKSLLDNIYQAVNYLTYPPTEEDIYTARNLAPIKELIKNPRILEFYEGCKKVLEFKDGALDMATNNIMRRSNGKLVFADPFWEGSNPYADADRARAMETDSWSDYEPKLYPGGRIPKEKKPKIKKHIYKNDDTPF
jgi:hypothetical protein